MEMDAETDAMLRGEKEGSEKSTSHALLLQGVLNTGGAGGSAFVRTAPSIVATALVQQQAHAEGQPSDRASAATGSSQVNQPPNINVEAWKRACANPSSSETSASSAERLVSADPHPAPPRGSFGIAGRRRYREPYIVTVPPTVGADRMITFRHNGVKYTIKAADGPDGRDLQPGERFTIDLREAQIVLPTEQVPPSAASEPGGPDPGSQVADASKSPAEPLPLYGPANHPSKAAEQAANLAAGSAGSLPVAPASVRPHFGGAGMAVPMLRRHMAMQPACSMLAADLVGVGFGRTVDGEEQQQPTGASAAPEADSAAAGKGGSGGGKGGSGGGRGNGGGRGGRGGSGSGSGSGSGFGSAEEEEEEAGSAEAPEAAEAAEAPEAALEAVPEAPQAAPGAVLPPVASNADADVLAP